MDALAFSWWWGFGYPLRGRAGGGGCMVGGVGVRGFEGASRLCSRCRVPGDVGFVAPLSVMCCIFELMGQCVVGFSRVGMRLIGYL
jgi:hypothetical protein